MLIPVRCFSCGGCIGKVAELYRAARKAMIAKVMVEQDIAPEMAAIAPEIYVDCQELFDALKVERECCRMCLSTSMVYSDYH